MTDSELIECGFACLYEKLGFIDTEHFIAAILSERFDYTEWRREHFADQPLDELLNATADYEKAHPFNKATTED